MRDLLLAFFWSVALPLTFLSPAAGVAFWIWDALLSPTELVYSFMISVPTNKLAALATLFGLFFKREARDVYLDSLGVLLILLSLSATISWETAIVPWDSDTDLYLKLIKEIVLAFSIMYLIRDQRWLHVTAFVVVVSISFLGVKEGLISLLTAGGHKIIGSRAIGDNNQLAAALITVIPLMMFLSRQFENKYLRFGMYGAAFLNVVTIIMTFSRGGAVGLLCLALLYLRKSKKRVRTTIALIALAACLYALAPTAWFTRVDTINDASDDSSFMGRVIAWKISWLIAEDNPVFGGGMHAVQHGPVWNLYSLRLPELAWIPTPPPDVIPHAAHSMVFEVLGDLGFLGLAIYTAIYILSYLKLLKIDRLGRAEPKLSWVVDLAQSMRISLIVYFLTGLLLSVAYSELLFILFALSSRSLRTTRQVLSSQQELERKDPYRREAIAGKVKPSRVQSIVGRGRRYSM